MDKALVHARTCTVFSARRSGFCCSAIASLEAQFSTETRVGVDHQTDAHGSRWRHSLK